MKRLSDIVERVSLRNIIEVVASQIVDGSTLPEAEPEGEEEFVKLHKTEKHPDPYGNKGSEKVKEAPYKKAPKDSGFPKEVKEEQLDELSKDTLKRAFSSAGSKLRGIHSSQSRIRKTMQGYGKMSSKKQGDLSKKWGRLMKKADKLSDTQEKIHDRLSGSFYTKSSGKKGSRKSFQPYHGWKATGWPENDPEAYKSTIPAAATKKRVYKEETELDEAIIARQPETRRSSATISRPKFDSRGNVILTKKASKNMGRYLPTTRKIKHGTKSWSPSDSKRFGEEFEQLDEGGPTRKHFQMAADTIAALPMELRRAHAEKHAEWFAKSNPRFNKLKFFDAAKVPLDDPKPGKVREETEQLNELKPETLMRYSGKAVESKRAAKEGLKTRYKHGMGPGALGRIVKNREEGMDRAAMRMGGTYETGKPLKVMIPGRDENDPSTGPYLMRKKKIYHGEEAEQLDEKAVSKKQQRLFGMALAMRRGESDRGSEKVASLAADLSQKKLRDFAKTKHKGLPEKKGSK